MFIVVTIIFNFFIIFPILLLYRYQKYLNFHLKLNLNAINWIKAAAIINILLIIFLA